MKLLRTVCLLILAQCPLQAQTAKNSEAKFINANVDAATKVVDNSILDFYTNVEFKLETFVIPVNTRFSATVNLVGGRAFLKVSSLKIGNEIHTVDWRAVGPDYQEGLPIIEADKSFEVHADQRVTFKDFTRSR